MSDNCCSTSSTNTSTNTSTTGGPEIPATRENLLGTTDTELAECPVMKGSMTHKTTAEAAGLFRDVEGTRYWFCCPGCAPLFDANPAHYISVG